MFSWIKSQKRSTAYDEISAENQRKRQALDEIIERQKQKHGERQREAFMKLMPGTKNDD